MMLTFCTTHILRNTHDLKTLNANSGVAFGGPKEDTILLNARVYFVRTGDGLKRNPIAETFPVIETLGCHNCLYRIPIWLFHQLGVVEKTKMLWERNLCNKANRGGIKFIQRHFTAFGSRDFPVFVSSKIILEWLKYVSTNFIKTGKYCVTIWTNQDYKGYYGYF